MNMRAVKTQFAIVLSLAMAACGGGGGGDQNPPSPQSQTIAFAQAGPLTLPIGATVTNAASGGGGTGAITYQSSNTSVVAVDATSGLATGISVGSATVTATKAADASFSQALATYTLDVTLAPQAIAFAEDGPLTALIGATLANTASGGSGTGAITYESSNTNVLTVGATSGIVASVAKGTATVTATKAADATFSQAEATYTVNVRTATPMTGWISETSSQMLLPQFIADQFWSARADTCPTPRTINLCPGADVIGGPGINLFHDLNATLATPAYHALASGLAMENATLVATRRFSERIGHAALFFKNRYWVIGGGEPQLPTNLATAPHTTLSDVWSSPDGKTWKRETSNAPWGPRWFHQAVVFDGAMWVIDGAPSVGPTSTDVWSSTDGVNWIKRTDDALLPWHSTHLNVVVFNHAMWAVSGGSAFSSTDGVHWTRRSDSGAIGGLNGRGYASLTVYDGSLWYIAGAPTLAATAADAVNDVWKSSDGITWIQVAANAPFTPRIRHQAFVVDGRLWVFGGQVSDGAAGTLWAQDAWSTTDGVQWTEEPTGALAATHLAKVVEQTEPERVTLIAGVQRGYSSNVWQTTNGIDWTALSAQAQFSPRDSRGVSFDAHVWIIGGGTADGTGSGGNSSEVWNSESGTTWTRVATQGTIFSPRDGHSVVVFHDKLWVIGGWDGGIEGGGTQTRLNDVWSSNDGVTWTKHEPTGGVIFSPRVGHDVVVFQDQLWVIAGNLQTETDSNEVWSSADGDTWTLVTQLNPFTARRSHRVVAFNGEMWMTGGATQTAVGADAGTADVWHSADGSSWTSELVGFPPRARHALEVFNGRMYMIGGVSGEDYLKSTIYSDVWSSEDGVLWEQETPVTPFPPRWSPALIHHGSELWLVGGYGLSHLNDVWRSSDAKQWYLGFSHQLVVP